MRPYMPVDRSLLVVVAAMLLALVACGGDSASNTTTGNTAPAATTVGQSASGEGENSGDTGATAGGGVDAAPAGRAIASVDGQELTWDLPGGVPCRIQDGEFSISFRTEENPTTLGAGGFLSNSGWGGDMVIEVPEPEGGVGVTQYFVDLAEHGDLLQIDGKSLTYSGPWMMRPPNDGTNPPPVDAGDGTLSATCA